MDFNEFLGYGRPSPSYNEPSWYDVAQICLNGHVINDQTKKYPQHNKKFCDNCGAETITSCPNCNTDIQGYYHMEMLGSGIEAAPSFCQNCGQSFPWTEYALQTAKEFSQEVEGLSDDEREILTKNLDEIIKETPNTNVAALKVKKIFTKIGKAGADTFKNILVGILSETAKKILWPS